MNRCMAACFCFHHHHSRALAATLRNLPLLSNSLSSSSSLLPTRYIYAYIRGHSSLITHWRSSSRRRRAVHNSVYDKNPEDHAVPNVLPDDVIQPQSEQYWAPHPKTGVFGPATELAFHASPAHNTTTAQDSVLEQKAFFRPLEDLEKPPPQP